MVGRGLRASHTLTLLSPEADRKISAFAGFLYIGLHVCADSCSTAAKAQCRLIQYCCEGPVLVQQELLKGCVSNVNVTGALS